MGAGVVTEIWRLDPHVSVRTVVSMMTCIYPVILMGMKSGAMGLSGSGRTGPRCVHICSGLCFWWWDVSASSGTGIFATKDPCAIPSSCLSSARRNQLKASSGLRSALFSVVYGQAKRKCPHGQSVRTPCCQIRLFVMLTGIIFIYVLDSPFCLIKKKK